MAEKEVPQDGSRHLYCCRIRSHKHSPEDTRDSGVRFVTLTGSNKWFRRTWFYILSYMTGHTLVISFTTCKCERINNYNMQVQALSLIWDNLTFTSDLFTTCEEGLPGFSLRMVHRLQAQFPSCLMTADSLRGRIPLPSSQWPPKYEWLLVISF